MHSVGVGTAPAPSRLQRWACGVAYAGTGFLGWQTQPGRADGLVAIQDLIEPALGEIAGEPIATRCAGRTDAGVHALSQVIQFDSPVLRPATAWTHGTRARLPATVRIRWARPVRADFDARFDARERIYHYLIGDGGAISPLWLGRCASSARALDLERLEAASSVLVGRHDFSAFRSSECQANSPIRTVREIRWRRQRGFVLMAIRADAFLHHMVRNLVGSLVYVGDGRRDTDWLKAVLEGGERALAAPTFDAAGLYLAGVRYDSGDDLPSDACELDLAALA